MLYWHPRRIARNWSAFKLAPPTRAPSTSGWLRSEAALSGLTLPPYWMVKSSATSGPNKLAALRRQKTCAACACPPAGLKGKTPPAHGGGLQPRQSRRHLAIQHALGLAALPLLNGLADA